MVTIPEKVLKTTLDYFLSNITSKYLEAIFGNSSLEGYNYLENSKSIFLKSTHSKRKIETHLFFNRERVGLPTIHIGMPSESEGQGNGISYDSDEEVEGSVFRNYGNRTYTARYSIVFTSNNTFEVLIMYLVVKSFLIGNVSILELNGLRNPKFSGADILLNDVISPDIYSRALYIECLYETHAPELELSEKVNNIEFNLIIDNG